MPIQYLQTSSSLSREDLYRNENFPNPSSLPAYPLTPYPIIPETRGCSPSALVTWDDLVQTTEPDAKQRTGTQCYAPSTSSLCRSSPNPSLNISSTELQRVLDSILDQVDWLAVAVKVAKNRAPSVYCKAVEKILLAHTYQLVKAEGEGDEVGKFKNGRDDKEYLRMYEDDKDEDGSEFSRNNEESGDCDKDVNNGENMQTNENDFDSDYEEDEMDEDGYNKDSEYQYI